MSQSGFVRFCRAKINIKNFFLTDDRKTGVCWLYNQFSSETEQDELIISFYQTTCFSVHVRLIAKWITQRSSSERKSLRIADGT